MLMSNNGGRVSTLDVCHVLRYAPFSHNHSCSISLSLASYKADCLDSGTCSFSRRIPNNTSASSKARWSVMNGELCSRCRMRSRR
jgi:hypothetical protein